MIETRDLLKILEYFCLKFLVNLNSDNIKWGEDKVFKSCYCKIKVM